MQATKNVFRDGQTLAGYIAPVEGLHEGLRFTRRPMLAEDVEEAEAQIVKATPRQAAGIVTLTIVAKLVSWSEVDDAGKPLPINAKTVGGLPYQLLTRTYRIIAGLAPSDLDRDAGEQTDQREAEQYLKRLAEATEQNKTLGRVEDEARVGN